MKKILTLLAVLFILVLAACGGNATNKEEEETKQDDANEDATQEEVTIKVGASSVPHAEILEEAKPILAEKGIELEIEQYEEYVLPNDDLASGELDANYFQHIPYLEQTVADTGYELTHIGSIHIEPIGIYSKSIEDIDAVPEGSEVILSNSVSDHGRILGLFQKAGLITIADGVEVADATIEDIEDNPKNLTFSPDYEPAFLPELYETEEDALVVINTNFAIGAGLSPQDDSLFIEEDDSPYVNIIAVKEEDKDNEALNTLVEVLQSEEIQSFITEKYEGAVVPVSK
ncbi:MetQ/NlpA family ABC transporter substrate-binding protein [Pseudogracilibacillus auburnensis]|uniref:MetQ/NlpA family ABC transporter substrate-binding protein n=1 Tax=Pseudogracilibacillus auburnensis TaxID=1494959 RepID=UPI001A965C97|nr:MetQ/NlpA family ABC transporter substrate-binding protein [Pseudogracilibacillus auburnensis]MBO1004972.1 MetQ/NlpA family ABC transporter substrate-binding protein [Pseudogracilibacillus auburnensis]